jgi:hypothetical protein
MEKNKTRKYFKYAIGEIVLVVIGILIALQINNWNENRKDVLQEQFILENLKTNIKNDIARIDGSIKNLQDDISDFNYCLKVLARKPDVNEQEFKNKLTDILNFINFEITTTTFDNIISTGKIELIKNEVLLNSIVNYYNYDYKQWDSASKDYTRNIIAPFLHEFDHVPYLRSDSRRVDISQFDIKPKTVEDYRKELFVINVLRSKLWLLEGQKEMYEELRTIMDNLLTQIDLENNKN